MGTASEQAAPAPKRRRPKPDLAKAESRRVEALGNDYETIHARANNYWGGQEVTRLRHKPGRDT